MVEARERVWEKIDELQRQHTKAREDMAVLRTEMHGLSENVKGINSNLAWILRLLVAVVVGGVLKFLMEGANVPLP